MSRDITLRRDYQSAIAAEADKKYWDNDNK